MPVLIQHYFEHKDLDDNITFLNYLEQHYNEVPHTDNDEERDRQLPFKAHGISGNSLVSMALPPFFEITPPKAYEIVLLPQIRINNEHIPNSAFAGKIWQPPKGILS